MKRPNRKLPTITREVDGIARHWIGKPMTSLRLYTIVCNTARVPK